MCLLNQYTSDFTLIKSLEYNNTNHTKIMHPKFPKYDLYSFHKKYNEQSKMDIKVYYPTNKKVITVMNIILI